MGEEGEREKRGKRGGEGFERGILRQWKQAPGGRL